MNNTELIEDYLIDASVEDRDFFTAGEGPKRRDEESDHLVSKSGDAA